MSDTVMDPAEQGADVPDTATEVTIDASPPSVHPEGSVERLKEKAAAIRARKSGTASAPATPSGGAATPSGAAPEEGRTPEGRNAQEGSDGGAPLASGGVSAAATDAQPESTGNGLSNAANDELAKLAARRGETTSTAQASEPDVADALKADADTGQEAAESERTAAIRAAGQAAVDAAGGDESVRHKAELEAAKASPGGRKSSGKMSAAQKAREKARAAAAKQKEKEKAAKEREKAKNKEKTEKQKAAEAARKEKEKERQAERKKAEDERKAKLEAERKARAAERAAKQTPDLLKKESAAFREAFAKDYALAGPKTDRNPDGIGLRRAKADRGDFAAGYMMATRRMRAEAKAGGA